MYPDRNNRTSDSFFEEQYRTERRKAELKKQRVRAIECFAGMLVFLIMAAGIFHILDVPYWTARGEYESILLTLGTIAMSVVFAVAGVKTTGSYLAEARVLDPDEYRKTKKAITVIVILTAASAAAVFALKMYGSHRREKENARLRAEYAEMRSSFGSNVTAWFEENNPYRGFTYLKEVQVRGYIVHDRDDIYPHFTVRLMLMDAFDSLNDRRQYELLKEEQRIGREAIREMLNSSAFEEYQKFQSISMSFLQDSYCRRSPEEAYFIETSGNRYQYAYLVSDYFIKNDKDHFVSSSGGTQKKTTPTPTPRAGKNYGSGKVWYNNDGDDYNAEDYDDPEDFYEDNRDAFEDLDDAADYLEDYWDEHGG